MLIDSSTHEINLTAHYNQTSLSVCPSHNQKMNNTSIAPFVEMVEDFIRVQKYEHSSVSAQYDISRAEAGALLEQTRDAAGILR